jgi:hypothetical protein
VSHSVIVQSPALNFKIRRVCSTVKENRSHLVNIQQESPLEKQRKPNAQSDKFRTNAHISAAAVEFSIETRRYSYDVCDIKMAASSESVRSFLAAGSSNITSSQIQLVSIPLTCR